MGNSFKTENNQSKVLNNYIVDESLQLVNEEENYEIISLYNKITQGKDLIVSVNNIFHFSSLPNNQFAEMLIQDGIFTSISNFRNFVTNSTRISSYKSMETLWNLLTKYDSSNVLSVYINVLYDIAYPNVTNNTDRINAIDKLMRFVKSFISNLSSNNDVISFDDFVQWSNNYAPYISKVYETFIHLTVWKDLLSPSFSPFTSPSISGSSSSIIKEYDLLPFAIYSNRLQGLWKKLYTSEADGMSFNRIAHHILGYNGPTCLLIRVMDESHTIIGAFADDKWKEQNRFYGSYKDFVFSFHPELRIYRVKSDSNQAYRWLNMRSYGMPHGLGFGGTIDGLGYRLFIPESLENCIARGSCLTYETGKLLSKNDRNDNNFEIDVLEVWGCGGEEIVNSGLQEQSNHRQMNEKTINQARKVDKATFFNNAFDQEFLLSKTMQHKREMNDRDTA